jgi:hypothetical protein
MPQLDIIAGNGEASPYALSGKRAVAINVWSSICAACVAELSVWSDHTDELLSAGLDVITHPT